LASFQSAKSLFDGHHLSYFSFFQKSEKPIIMWCRHQDGLTD
jgi:hypothetical protein